MSRLLRVGRMPAAAVLLSGVLALSAGCERGRLNEGADGPTAEELVSFYSPQSIKILQFTKPKSFDDDAIPDGIGLSLHTLDAAGDPIKAYGTFVMELYAYRPASPGHRGELLHTWTQLIANPTDQKQYWEKATKTYEFQLSWEGQPLEPQKRYILAVSLQAPGAERLFDEHQFEFRVSRKDILDAMNEPKP